MEYVRLGQSGLKVSRLCLGTMNMGTPQWKPWIFDEAQSEPIVRHALEAGVNFIDLADFYSTGVGEEVVGRILKSLARREEIVVTTKGEDSTRQRLVCAYPKVSRYKGSGSTDDPNNFTCR